MKNKIAYILLFTFFIFITILSVVYSIKVLDKDNIDPQLYIESLLCLIGGVVGLGCMVFMLLLYINGRKKV